MNLPPKKGDGLLAAKGFKKDGEGFWVDAQGKRLNVNIIGFGAEGSAIGPILVEMLKRRGVEASMALPPDFDSRFQKGEFDGAIYGHGGSINEPYATMRLYQAPRSRCRAPTRLISRAGKTSDTTSWSMRPMSPRRMTPRS